MDGRVDLESDQALRNLNRIQRGTFEELIADDPEGKAIIQGTVETEAADGTVITARDVEGEGILLVGWIVDDVQTWSLTEDLAGGGQIDGLFELGADGDAVSAEDGNADACDAGTEVWVMHDLPTLVFHLHFFLCVAAIQERIHMRDGIEGDLMRIDRRLGV